MRYLLILLLASNAMATMTAEQAAVKTQKQVYALKRKIDKRLVEDVDLGIDIAIYEGECSYKGSFYDINRQSFTNEKARLEHLGYTADIEYHTGYTLFSVRWC